MLNDNRHVHYVLCTFRLEFRHITPVFFHSKNKSVAIRKDLLTICENDVTIPLQNVTKRVSNGCK